MFKVSIPGNSMMSYSVLSRTDINIQRSIPSSPKLSDWDASKDLGSFVNLYLINRWICRFRRLGESKHPLRERIVFPRIHITSLSNVRKCVGSHPKRWFLSQLQIKYLDDQTFVPGEKGKRFPDVKRYGPVIHKPREHAESGEREEKKGGSKHRRHLPGGGSVSADAWPPCTARPPFDRRNWDDAHTAPRSPPHSHSAPSRQKQDSDRSKSAAISACPLKTSL